MTRKDFQLIADCIAVSVTDHRTRDRVAAVFADALSFTNDRFDRSKFVIACRRKGTPVFIKPSTTENNA